MPDSVHSPGASGITYRERDGASIAVLSEGRVIGHILRVVATKGRDGGYVYAPKGSTLRGAVLPSIGAVKRSLEDPAA